MYSLLSNFRLCSDDDIRSKQGDEWDVEVMEAGRVNDGLHISRRVGRDARRYYKHLPCHLL